MSLDDTTFVSGPSFHVDLPLLDACHPVHYSRRLLIFRCASSAQRNAQITALKTCLQALVLQCPVLGGIVAPLPPDESSDRPPEWRTILPDKGIELVVRDLRTALPSFNELEAAQFPVTRLPYDLLVPVPKNIGRDPPFAACKIQFSIINGGTILTFSVSHSVGDGTATDELMRILREETRFSQDHSTRGVSNVIPSQTKGMGLDRSILRNMTSDIPFKIQDHPGYSWDPTPPEQPNVQSFAATSPEIPVLLRISAESLAQLKADATSPDGPPISTHDALSALIWRSLLLIRSRRTGLSQDVLASTTGSIFMPSDARRHLDIPKSYIGNVVYQLCANLDLGTLFSPSGLQQAARAIRRSISAVNSDLVKSYMAKTNEKWVSWQFLSTASTTGVAMGTDWTSKSPYGDDWGAAFGPLVSYRHPNGDSILPKLPDGGAELILSVMPGEVEMLTGPDGFGKDRNWILVYRCAHFHQPEIWELNVGRRNTEAIVVEG